MATELTTVDVTDAPELLRLAEQVQDSGRSAVLRRGDTDLAVVSPIPRRRKSRSRVLKSDDPLFGLIGIGKSGIPGGTADRKHEQLKRAYRHS